MVRTVKAFPVSSTINEAAKTIDVEMAKIESTLKEKQHVSLEHREEGWGFTVYEQE